jgi:hypothetical protein
VFSWWHILASSHIVQARGVSQAQVASQRHANLNLVENYAERSRIIGKHFMHSASCTLWLAWNHS